MGDITVELHSGMTPEEWNRAMAKLEEFGFAQKAAEKKGKWEIDVDCEYDVFDIAGERTWAIKAKCSECDFAMRFIEGHGVFNYCPGCGAKMEGKSDE